MSAEHEIRAVPILRYLYEQAHAQKRCRDAEEQLRLARDLLREARTGTDAKPFVEALYRRVSGAYRAALARAEGLRSVSRNRR